MARVNCILHYSITVEYMSKIHDFSRGMSYAIDCKYLSEALETFNHYQFYKK